MLLCGTIQCILTIFTNYTKHYIKELFHEKTTEEMHLKLKGGPRPDFLNRGFHNNFHHGGHGRMNHMNHGGIIIC